MPRSPDTLHSWTSPVESMRRVLSMPRSPFSNVLRPLIGGLPQTRNITSSDMKPRTVSTSPSAVARCHCATRFRIACSSVLIGNRARRVAELGRTPCRAPASSSRSTATCVASSGRRTATTCCRKFSPPWTDYGRPGSSGTVAPPPPPLRNCSTSGISTGTPFERFSYPSRVTRTVSSMRTPSCFSAM